MLRTLVVQNLALIESIELDLSHGFTCLTGETGAGKSILLDAVGLLLGSRGSAELIRTGEDRALVEGNFDVTDKIADMVETALNELGIVFNGTELIVSREINRAGKSLARINGRMITVAALRNLGKILVQQHGQHDNLILLKKDEQLRLLDDFHLPTILPILTKFQEIFKAHQELSRRLQEADRNSREQAQRLDFLRMQVMEIGAAKVKIGEEVALRERRGMLQHADRLQHATESVYTSLYEGSGTSPAINGSLYRLSREIAAVVELDKGLAELKEYLETAQVNLAEAAEFSRAYRDKLNFEPEELGKIEDRLAILEKLFRKYGQNEQEVLTYDQRALDEIHELENIDESMAGWLDEKQQLEAKLAELATQLTAVRNLAAREFEEQVQTELAKLSMPNVRLAIKFHSVPYYDKGADEVEIFFSANQGEELKPLAKIASGGELSRFMLALAKVLAGAAPTDTMIFDEIDTGISGAAAQKVAQTIVEISKYHQVLCVTHQAQMACMADEHMIIEKNVSHERTFTLVRPLIGEERIEELAKMLGGQLVTATTRSHARELLMRKQGLSQ